MIKFLKNLYSLPQIFKKKIKQKQFSKYSTHGNNLQVSASANCLCNNKNNIVIGNNCDICGTLSANGNGKISIGNYTTIRGESIIGSINNISIGDYVIISNNVHIYDNNNHPTNPNVRIAMCREGFYGENWNWDNSENKPIVIKDNVWICERASILKGVTINEGSIVGCNSVVTKDVPPYTIVAGNPATIVKRLVRG